MSPFLGFCAGSVLFTGTPSAIQLGCSLLMTPSPRGPTESKELLRRSIALPFWGAEAASLCRVGESSLSAAFFLSCCSLNSNCKARARVSQASKWEGWRSRVL